MQNAKTVDFQLVGFLPEKAFKPWQPSRWNVGSIDIWKMNYVSKLFLKEPTKHDRENF